MAIHGLCIVKNEADVIAQTLRTASRWCDHIYVFDNGSDDGTWQIVLDLARELPAVVPFKTDSKPFTDSLRDEILCHYRSRARSGDWWAIIDADEFMIDDPRAFLARVPQRFRAVWPQLYSFVFTDVDADRFRENPSRYAADVPLTERLHHYVLGEYSELRFFRHDPRLTGIPGGIGPIYPERIRLRHYGYRSPDQIDIRLKTRREPMERGEFIHEKRSNWVPGGDAAPGPATASDLPRVWQERIVPHQECLVECGVDSLLPPLPFSPPATTSWHAKPDPQPSGLLGVIGRIIHLPSLKRPTADATPRLH